MKKVWLNAEVTELNINATNNIPTTELVADDFQDGKFKQGDSNGSGPRTEIPYFPE